MPIFDYKCICGEEFEQFLQKDETPQCPKCKSEEVTKQPSLYGGYHMGYNPGGERSVQEGAFKRRKK